MEEKRTEEIERLRRQIESYEELMTDCMDDGSYVARGNGFCDAKYSEDFIEGQIERLRVRLAELEGKG